MTPDLNEGEEALIRRADEIVKSLKTEYSADATKANAYRLTIDPRPEIDGQGKKNPEAGQRVTSFANEFGIILSSFERFKLLKDWKRALRFADDLNVFFNVGISNGIINRRTGKQEEGRKGINRDDSDVVKEAERILKLLKDDEIGVTEEGKNRSVQFAFQKDGKMGTYHEQYPAWLATRMTQYEQARMWDSPLDSVLLKAAGDFIEAYNWGKTYGLLDTSELKKLRGKVTELTEKLSDRERRLQDAEVDKGRQDARIKLLEDTLTKNGINFGSAVGDVE